MEEKIMLTEKQGHKVKADSDKKTLSDIRAEEQKKVPEYRM